MRTLILLSMLAAACSASREAQPPPASSAPAQPAPAPAVAPRPAAPLAAPSDPAPAATSPEAATSAPAPEEKPTAKALPPACPREGQAAPPFSLLMADGSPGVSLRAALERKRPVVLGFWAHWCVPCRAELPLLEKLSKEYGDRLTMVLVHVGPDETRMNAKLAELGVTIRSASDDTGKRQEKYCATELPLTFLIDKDGTIKGRYQGLHLDEFERAIRAGLKSIGAG